MLNYYQSSTSVAAEFVCKTTGLFVSVKMWSLFFLQSSTCAAILFIKLCMSVNYIYGMSVIMIMLSLLLIHLM